MKTALIILTPVLFAAIPTLPPPPARDSIETVEIEVGDITRMQVSGLYQVTVTKGPPSIKITGKDTALRLLNMRYDNTILQIAPYDPKGSWIAKLFNLRGYDEQQYQIGIQVSAPIIPEVILSGNSQLTSTDDLGIVNIILSGNSQLNIQNNKSPSLKAKLYDNALFNAHSLKTKSVDFNLHGSSKINMISLALDKESHITQSGSSSLKLSSLTSPLHYTTCSGTANIKVGTISTRDIFLALYGGSTMKMKKLETQNLYFKQNGSSRLSIQEGICQNASGVTTENAKYNFNQLNPKYTEIHEL